MPKADLRRLQVAAIDAPRVTPAGAPSGAYVLSPARQDTSGGLVELADALSTFSPVLDGFARRSRNNAANAAKANAQAQADAAKAEKERQTALAEQRLAGMTTADVRTAIKTGAMTEYDNPFYREAADNIVGRRTMAEVKAQLDADIASGDVDPVSSDLSSILTDRIAASGLDTASPSFAAGFTKVAEEYRTSLLETQHTARHDDYVEKSEAIVFEAVSDVIDNGDPATIAKALQDTTADLSQMLGVPHGDIEAVQVELATTLAEQGSVEMVEAIMKGDRKHGSISSKKGMGKKAETLITRAKTVRDKDRDDAYGSNNYALNEEFRSGSLTGGQVDRALRSDQITPSQANTLKGKLFTKAESDRKKALKARETQQVDRKVTEAVQGAAVSLMSGRGYEIDDIEVTVGDTTRKVKAKDVKEMILAQTASELSAGLPEGPEGTAVFRTAMQDAIRGSGATLKAWRGQMDNLQTDLEIMRSTGEIPGRVSNAIDLFSSLDTDIAEAHVKDKETLGFLRAIKDMTGPSMGLSVEDAVVRASSIAQLPPLPRRTKATAAVVAEVGKSDIDFSRLPFNDGLSDAGLVSSRDRVAEIAADMAVYSDLPEDQLVAEALQRFMATHVPVAGHAIRVPDGHDPDVFNSQAHAFLKGWALDQKVNSNGEGIPDDAWDDVYLKEAPRKGFRIFRDGLPIYTGRVYSPETIERTAAVVARSEQDARDAKDRQKAVDKAAKAKERRDNFDEWVETTGKPQVENARRYRDDIRSR